MMQSQATRIALMMMMIMVHYVQCQMIIDNSNFTLPSPITRDRCDLNNLQDHQFTIENMMNLSLCNITSIPHNAFINVSDSILSIDLSYNSINELPIDAFAKTRIHHIFLQHNQLEYIVATMFPHTITYMDITGNPLKCTPVLNPSSSSSTIRYDDNSLPTCPRTLHYQSNDSTDHNMNDNHSLSIPHLNNNENNDQKITTRFPIRRNRNANSTYENTPTFSQSSNEHSNDHFVRRNQSNIEQRRKRSGDQESGSTRDGLLTIPLFVLSFFFGIIFHALYFI